MPVYKQVSLGHMYFFVVINTTQDYRGTKSLWIGDNTEEGAEHNY